VDNVNNLKTQLRAGLRIVLLHVSSDLKRQ